LKTIKSCIEICFKVLKNKHYGGRSHLYLKRKTVWESSYFGSVFFGRGIRILKKKSCYPIENKIQMLTSKNQRCTRLR